MPAPKKPNTSRATETNRRRGDETAAVRLREHGWLVVPPEHLHDGRGTVAYLATEAGVSYEMGGE